MEYLKLVDFSIGAWVTRAYFTLELGNGIQWYRAELSDEVLRNGEIVDKIHLNTA